MRNDVEWDRVCKVLIDVLLSGQNVGRTLPENDQPGLGLY